MSIYPDKDYLRAREVEEAQKKDFNIDYSGPKDKAVREYIEQMKKAQRHAKDKGLSRK